MHNIKTNFDKILDKIKPFDKLFDGRFVTHLNVEVSKPLDKSAMRGFVHNIGAPYQLNTATSIVKCKKVGTEFFALVRIFFITNASKICCIEVVPLSQIVSPNSHVVDFS